MKHASEYLTVLDLWNYGRLAPPGTSNHLAMLCMLETLNLFNFRQAGCTAKSFSSQWSTIKATLHFSHSSTLPFSLQPACTGLAQSCYNFTHHWHIQYRAPGRQTAPQDASTLNRWAYHSRQNWIFRTAVMPLYTAYACTCTYMHACTCAHIHTHTIVSL